MDLAGFANKLEEATKNLSEADRNSLKQIFQNVSKEVFSQPVSESKAMPVGTKIPDGPTERHVKLKERFLKHVPSISIDRARIITDVYKENIGMPPLLLRSKSFLRNCETAPLVNY